MEAEKLSEQITVPLTKADRAKLEKAAKADHRKPTQFARLAIMDAARTKLEKSDG